MTGKNPDFYDGYPVEFNLSLAGKLDQILNDSLVGYRVPDLVRERLEATRPAVRRRPSARAARPLAAGRPRCHV